MKTVTLIGKGPSAQHAAKFIAAARTDVAVVNDAGKLFPGRIHYTFFTEGGLFERLRKQIDRTDLLVSPKATVSKGVPDWQIKPHVTYPEHECCGDLISLAAMIARGGICHHHTTTGALHWLAKHGRYEKIRIIGVDGGSNYAPGVTPVKGSAFHQLKKSVGSDFMSEWKEITVRLCNLLKCVYATQFEWWEE